MRFSQGPFNVLILALFVAFVTQVAALQCRSYLGFGATVSEGVNRIRQIDSGAVAAVNRIGPKGVDGSRWPVSLAAVTFGSGQDLPARALFFQSRLNLPDKRFPLSVGCSGKLKQANKWIQPVRSFIFREVSVGVSNSEKIALRCPVMPIADGLLG